MKAIVRERYGPPDVLELRDVEPPEVADGAVLVRVDASSVNPVDWYETMGRPYVGRMTMGLRRPKVTRLGRDFAGRIEATGEEVFGVKNGAFAECVAVREGRLAPKPASLTLEQAATIPIASVTALQALRDKGGVQPGQHVLINGASGGVGTFTVQIAKWLGAEVTGVCSTPNVDLVRSLGADHVVDYRRDDFTRSGRRYDLMIDVAGSRSFSECRRVLAPDATLVIVGGPKANRFLGPFAHVVKTRAAAIGKGQTVVFFIAEVTKDALTAVGEMIEAGKVTPVIDRRYELLEVPDALRYLGEGHACGKVVIAVR
jgi:NADPH:quinone reductase-like Zn-dependent oxidoreductase